MFLLAVFIIVSDITVLQLGVERGAVFVDVGQVAVSFFMAAALYIDFLP